MWGYALLVLGVLVFCAIIDPWWDKKPPSTQKTPEPTPSQRTPNTTPGHLPSDRFQHQGGYHNRYYRTHNWRPFWMRRPGEDPEPSHYRKPYIR